MKCNCKLVKGEHEYKECVPILNARTLEWNKQQGDGTPIRNSVFQPHHLRGNK
jgi:hypothetical protein